MGPPRRPPAPQTDEDWERRSLEGVDRDDGKVRHDVRRVTDKADEILAIVESFDGHVETIAEMAKSREKYKVLRNFAKHFVVWVAVTIAALSAFKEQLLSLIRGPSP